MKQLKEYIRKELKSLKEGKTVKIPLPDDANISNKTYDILDRNQYPLALKALEDLQTKPIIKTTGDEESSSIEEPTEEPTEEPVEEPAEEPEA